MQAHREIDLNAAAKSARNAFFWGGAAVTFVVATTAFAILLAIIGTLQVIQGTSNRPSTLLYLVLATAIGVALSYLGIRARNAARRYQFTPLMVFLPTLFVVWLFTFPIVMTLSDRNPDEPILGVFGILFMISAIMGMIGLRSCFRLRSLRLGDSGPTINDRAVLIEQDSYDKRDLRLTTRKRREPVASSRPSRMPSPESLFSNIKLSWRGWGVRTALALLALILLGLMLVLFGAEEGGTAIIFVPLMLLFFGGILVFALAAYLLPYILGRRAVRYVQRSIRGTLDEDSLGTIKPIVLLRSFQDDRRQVASSGFRHWLLQLNPFFYFRVPRIRLEEAVTQYMEPVAPVIAIGEPGESLPELGAIRAYFADDEWQDRVKAWIARSRLVAMIAGQTPSVQWELRTIIDSGQADKLLFLLPPEGGQYRAARVAFAREALAGTPAYDVLASADPEHMIALFTAPSGKAVLIKGLGGHQVYYDLACLYAVSEMARADLN